MGRYDAVIVGAGHNGLVCAAYLARGGRRVLVLEAAEAPGGLAAKREFHPGFHVGIAHSVGHFSAKVARDLHLHKHGFAPPQRHPTTVALNRHGAHLVLDGQGVSGAVSGDSQAYDDYTALMRRFAKALKPFWLKTMPRIGAGGLADAATFARIGLSLRRLGKQGMREFLRIAALPMRDLMDERFASDLLKIALSWDGLIGSKLAPRSPNGAVIAMLYRMAEASADLPAGGPADLVRALRAAATTAGAEIRCGALVERIDIGSGAADVAGRRSQGPRQQDGALEKAREEADRVPSAEAGQPGMARPAGGATANNRGEKQRPGGPGSIAEGLAARGVHLRDGEFIAADLVVSATDPQRTFLDLVGVEHLDIGFTNRIRRLRCDGLVGKLHLALNGVPKFRGLDAPDGRLLVAPDLDAIEFAFDAAKYGNCPTHPVLEIVVPSLHDPSCAPAGRHVLSAHVMYVPRRRQGGWSDAARDAVRQTAIDTIADYAPGIRQQILAGEFLTPTDIERDYLVTGGHWHHTELALDQMLMMRPTYGAAQYRTPIAGLYLCGAGSHPGGDLTGLPGHNAAREILR